MFTDINIYSINNKTDHISETYILYRKKILYLEQYNTIQYNTIQYNTIQYNIPLGSYPYTSWRKWISLSNRISDATLLRLEPYNR